MNARNGFDACEDWCSIGMALKLEYGDDGLELWAHSHNDTVTPAIIATKWRSFASEPKRGAITLNSFMKRAHELGWTGTLRPSISSMFGGVALATAVGSAEPSPGHSDLTAPAVGLTDFAAFRPGGTFCYLPTREHWPATSVNAKVGDVMVNGISRIKAATWLSQNRAADSMAWCPGEPMLIANRLLVDGGWIEKPGDMTLNNYRPATIDPREGDVSPWLNHCKTVYPQDWLHSQLAGAPGAAARRKN